MKNQFPGFFRPTETEFDELWKAGLIVPDSNILLHLIRYGEETRRQVLDTFRTFKPRVWIPYRVGYEFVRRWRDVDATNRNAYLRLQEQVRSAGKALIGAFAQFSRHQVIDSEAEKKKIDEFVQSLCASLDEASKRHPSIADAEGIVDEVVDLIGDSIGPEPGKEVKDRWIQEGQTRFAAEIPPGYKDKKGKSGEDVSMETISSGRR